MNNSNATNLLPSDRFSILDQIPLPNAPSTAAAPPTAIGVTLHVNGTEYSLQLDPRVTLLDALREYVGLTGTKKGCDHGQCGACTVLVNGHRIYSCLTLAVSYESEPITTIEGLAEGEELHPIQAAFIHHDGFQCGYCTPGQIMSAVGLLAEAQANVPSHVSANVAASQIELTDAEIRERMSGNICRCGAYLNILAAIREVWDREQHSNNNGSTDQTSEVR